MLWLATAELPARVSNTGALGTISPHAGMEKSGIPSKNLQFQIAKTRNLTKRPFAINIPLDLQQSRIFIDIVLKEKVRVVVTSAGNPELYTELLHKIYSASIGLRGDGCHGRRDQEFSWLQTRKNRAIRG